jgi:Mrp family chromosome partitioning ATPase
LKEKADILIIDGMPLFVPETMVWARQVNGVLLVVRPGRVRRKLSRTLVEKFQGAGSNLLGVVLNRMRISNLGFYNRYRYYYPYYGYHDSQGGGEKDGRNSARFSGTNGKKRRVRIGTPGIE